MTSFEIAAVLLSVAAVCGYLNHRFLRLPATTGTLAIALVSSFVIVGLEAVTPSTHLREPIHRFLEDIDFNETLMRGLLSFLLFAGALHVNLAELLRSKWAIAALSTIGVLISTVVVGALTWWTFGLAGIPMTLPAAMIFGALISPTDPVAVMGLLRELRAPAGLEAEIAGESLFNDGVGVVVFLALVSLAMPAAPASITSRLRRSRCWCSSRGRSRAASCSAWPAATWPFTRSSRSTISRSNCSSRWRWR